MFRLNYPTTTTLISLSFNVNDVILYRERRKDYCRDHHICTGYPRAVGLYGILKFASEVFFLSRFLFVSLSSTVFCHGDRITA